MKHCIRATLTSLIMVMISCSDFVDIDPPPNLILKETVFSSDSYAQSAMTGVYRALQTNRLASGEQTGLTALSGLSADDFYYYHNSQFYENELSSYNNEIEKIWLSCYNTIYMSNSILEGLENSRGVSGSVKQQLIGEAKFIRAFAHFYLTQLFGDVPIVTTTDVTINRKVFRSARGDVYARIEADLAAARELLPETYTGYGQEEGKDERIRVNKYAASAMLARFYLFKKDWQRAEQEATRVLDNTAQYELLEDLNSVFLKNSREAIWQLKPGSENTYESGFYIITDNTIDVSLSDSLLNSFDPIDKRRINWVGSYTSTLPGNKVYYYPYKYKALGIRGSGIAAEYSMVLRLAEQRFIRAEARLKQGKLTGTNSAQSDINAIRTRAGLPNTSAVTAAELMSEVLLQRRLELFSEWGHRWLDLKRTGKATEVLAPIKPLWNPYDTLYPIPNYDIVNNHNLTQNAGYQ